MSGAEEPAYGTYFEPFLGARAAFNMVALHLAGYTYDQIELFHPANMTADRLHELLDKKMSSLLRKRLKIEHISKAEGTPNDRSD